MLSEDPHFYDASPPDQLRPAAYEAEARLPRTILDAIQRAADLLEEIGWAGEPRSSLSRFNPSC